MSLHGPYNIAMLDRIIISTVNRDDLRRRGFDCVVAEYLQLPEADLRVRDIEDIEE
jgi:hypothetical protein